MRRLALVLLCLLSAAPAAAYPQYIGKSYTTCATCHYSPTGGGMPNSYGHAVSEATLPDTWRLEAIEGLKETLAKPDVTGRDDAGVAALQFDAGLDARLLLLPAVTEVDGDATLVPIPMLLELDGVAAYGPAMLYASLSPRRAGEEQRPDTVFSREHWASYELSDAWSLRAGRIQRPFGLRLADHTAYTREIAGQGKWDQSYGVELDLDEEAGSLAVALFAGDLILDDTAAQQRGIAASGTWAIASRAALGGSALFSRSERSQELAAALHARVRWVQRAYSLLEATAMRRQVLETEAAELLFAGYLRAGWFALESLDLYAEWGGRSVPAAWNLTKGRYSLGADWKLLPWLTLAPAAHLEEEVEGGPAATAMLQLHVVY